MTEMDMFEKLRTIIEPYGSVAIAYSGGVDSSFLMAAATEILGAENVLGIYVENDLHPKREKFDAYVMAEMLGWKVKVISVGLDSDPRIAENTKDRCYYCKSAAFKTILDYAKEKGFSTVMDGTNCDDLGEYRPGLKALEELKIVSPLKEAGFGKEDVRKVSKARYDLPTWNKPSNSCLATRIPYGTPLTHENLATVEKGEVFLHQLGYLVCRMRLHGNLARIELPVEDFAKFMSLHRETVSDYFKELGVLYTTLDVLGFRSGSQDESLEVK